MDEKNPDEAGFAAPEPATPAAAPAPAASARAVTPPEERPWYLRPSTAIWLGPLLLVACLVMRFGWNGLEGPPFPFWGVAYALGAAGIYLMVMAWGDRKSRA
jgi:hypothetical protein